MTYGRVMLLTGLLSFAAGCCCCSAPTAGAAAAAAVAAGAGGADGVGAVAAAAAAAAAGAGALGRGLPSLAAVKMSFKWSYVASGKPANASLSRCVQCESA